jgi:hypothetical protein
LEFEKLFLDRIQTLHVIQDLNNFMLGLEDTEVRPANTIESVITHDMSSKFTLAIYYYVFYQIYRKI